MMHKKNTKLSMLLPAIICIIFSTTSGCFNLLDDLSKTMYASSPTRIRYTISYGYNVTASGSGKYEIAYGCELPFVLQGTVHYHLLTPDNYVLMHLGNTTLVQWNITSEEPNEYHLGVTATIDASHVYLSDLSGKNAATLSELNNKYPDLVAQYCNEQSNGNTVVIAPNHIRVQQTAHQVLRDVNSTNSLQIAQALFIWLKEHITYAVHMNNTNVQPASVTLLKKTGDCDDLSFLYISLCRSVGIPARFIRGYLLTETRAGYVSGVPHAWVEVFVGNALGTNGWIPVECACVASSCTADVHQNFGLESAFHLRLFVDDGSNESLRMSLSGISYKIYGHTQTLDVESFVAVTQYTILEQKQLIISRDNQRSFT